MLYIVNYFIVINILNCMWSSKLKEWIMITLAHLIEIEDDSIKIVTSYESNAQSN